MADEPNLKPIPEAVADIIEAVAKQGQVLALLTERAIIAAAQIEALGIASAALAAGLRAVTDIEPVRAIALEAVARSESPAVAEAMQFVSAIFGPVAEPTATLLPSHVLN